MNSKIIAEIVSVKPRFGRSVNLERDFYNQISLDGYVLTLTSRQALDRILQALNNEQLERAFTLTGPYGSGKSTFALFAGRIFNFKNGNSSALSILKEKAPATFEVFENKETAPRFLPVLISGSRESLAPAILRGIRTALEKANEFDFKTLIARVKLLQKAELVTGKQLIRLLRQISEALNEDNNHKIGILLVIDELGKLLEYAALNPEKSDIFLLQELAEATKTFENPFFLITILHQAFERYAERLGRHERVEWMKVQGRFEDIAFQEPNEQVLQILKSAFELNETIPETKQLRKHGEELAEQSFNLGLCGKFKKTACSDLLIGCMPLHPTVALTLGHIFRRFGQNERSLFAFLASNEAFGLNDFLRNNVWDKNNPKTIKLDRVYDYLIAAMGSALYAGAESRKWAEIDAALNRLANPSELEVRLLKAVGLLGVIGDLGNLKSSRDILVFALTDSNNSANQINDCLEDLQRQSIVTERRFNDTFAIWEGSDINLDERFREAENHVDPNASLAENLTANFEARPLVAKRHSDETGTLRFFEILYVDPSNLTEKVAEQLTDADGRIIYVLSGNDDERKKIAQNIEANHASLQTLIAIPQNLTNLREAVFNVACWQRVGRNTPALESDRAARTELAARLFDAEHSVTHWLNKLQTDTTADNCRWFWNAEELEIANTRNLQSVLSDICDKTFYEAPILKNELSNRRNLSSAATAARRLLFEAMYEHPDKFHLGIEGYPPQLSIYLSILEKTKIHREENGKFGFFPPPNSDPNKADIVWERIVAFLEETETQRKPVSEIFEILQSPPFGLKEGVVPILFLAVLLHFDSEAALYEKGTFQPKLTLPILERLCKKPETFSVQLCRIGEVRSKVIEKLAAKILPENISSKKKQLEVLTLVKPLVRFAKDLNQFTQFTRKISPKAQKIRQALIAAREPDALLFKQLPEACGFKEITADAEFSGVDAERLAKKLQDGLSELKRAYPNLLLEIEQMLSSAFRIEKGGDELRTELTSRVQLLSRYAVAPKLKSFILRASDTDMEFTTWLESLGALLGSKPLANWHDDDISQFELNLAEIARSFTSLESLTFELNNRNPKETNGNTEFLRLSLTRLGEIEKEEVLTINEAEKQKIQELKFDLGLSK